LSELNVNSGWFAVLNDVIIASGKNEQEVKQRLTETISEDKLNRVFIFNYKMPNDNHLIDEYDKLQKLKNEIDTKIEFLKVSIIKLAQEKNTDVLFGTNKKCSIKEYEKIVYPEDKTSILELIKKKGIYDKFSSINYFKLSPAIIGGILTWR